MPRTPSSCDVSVAATEAARGRANSCRHREGCRAHLLNTSTDCRKQAKGHRAQPSGSPLLFASVPGECVLDMRNLGDQTITEIPRADHTEPLNWKQVWLHAWAVSPVFFNAYFYSVIILGTAPGPCCNWKERMVRGRAAAASGFAFTTGSEPRFWPRMISSSG